MAVTAEQITGLADLYHLNALGFAHPVPELHAQLTNGYFQQHYDARLLQAGWQPARLPCATVDFERFEADYITLFQVGGNGSPPCSLCETDYGLGDGSRGEQLVELTRFYRNFGLRLTTDAEENEQPDHLTCELELMAFLGFRQADACTREIDDAPYRLAQRDFLERRLGAWTPTFVQQATETAKALGVDPIFPALAGALGALVRDHLERLRDP
jgi:DMSO reductase family type II enzyme chaperone